MRILPSAVNIVPVLPTQERPKSSVEEGGYYPELQQSVNQPAAHRTILACEIGGREAGRS